jgi:hypothetical protein
MSDFELDASEIAGYVTVENHFYPEEYEVEIPHLGTLPNFGTKALDAVQVETFKNAGYEWPEDNHLVLVVKEPEPVVEEEESSPPPPDEEPTGGSE